MKAVIPLLVLVTLRLAGAPVTPADSGTSALAREVHDKGWIFFGARTSQGDWDVFCMRPDGSDRRNLSRTPEYNEGLPRVSADGRRLLYRRIPRGERFDNNRHGAQGELVFARADGAEPQVFGQPGEFPWACWSPDGRSLACLERRGLVIVDLATRKERAFLDRKGFFQQIVWSPDGQWVCGVANSFATGWSVARMELATGAVNAVSTVDCCTPDWFPDSQQVIFSRRPMAWTQLWRADGQGKERRLVYAEDGRHVYGGCVSPDGKYVLFTGNKEEDGDAQHNGAPMALLRLADAPILPAESLALRQQHPNANRGPVLQLPVGWEPHWTATEPKSIP